MLTAYVIAFILAVFLFGFPSKRNFDKLEGNHLIWRSKYFWISILSHGVLAILVLWFIQWLNITINFNGVERTIEHDAWIYGIFAGLSYSGFLYTMIGGLSITGGRMIDNERSIKSSMDFYTSLLERHIKDDIYALSRSTVAKRLSAVSPIKNVGLGEFVTILGTTLGTEDVGILADIISEKKSNIPNRELSDDEVNEIILNSVIDDFFRKYLMKYGKRRFIIDFERIKSEVERLANVTSPVE